MTFYVNPSWACALFRNNKQHVVLGQNRNYQRVEESGLWRIQRERWIEVKYLPNGTNAFFQLLSMTVHQYDKWLCKTVHDLCWFDQYGQSNQLIVNFILCQGNLNFCSEKFQEPWYNLSSETEVMLWKPEMWIHISVETKFFS
jgi:hypothetical protein